MNTSVAETVREEEEYLCARTFAFHGQLADLSLFLPQGGVIVLL